MLEDQFKLQGERDRSASMMDLPPDVTVNPKDFDKFIEDQNQMNEDIRQNNLTLNR